MTKEQEIQKNMFDLGITRAEAEELYLYDHEEIENAEADTLTEKAKQIKRYEHADKPRKKSEKVRKVNEQKKLLLKMLINGIKDSVSITDVHNEADFSFDYGAYNYTVKLVEHRPKKQGVLEQAERAQEASGGACSCSLSMSTLRFVNM